MIIIHYHGRYGNRFFQLSAANILAKKYNQPIINPIRNKILRLYEPVHADNNEETDNAVIIHNNNFLDENPSLRHLHIVVKDFFQTKLIIEEFIRYNEYQTNIKQKNAAFVHIRLGDRILKKMFLDYEYYEYALSKIPTNNLMVSSDNPDHEIVQKILKKYNGTLIKDSLENTMLLGASCKYKVLSLGTFSWWIGFLGNILYNDFSKYTVCPNAKKHPGWHGKIFPMFNWIEV